VIRRNTRAGVAYVAQATELGGARHIRGMRRLIDVGRQVARRRGDVPNDPLVASMSRSTNVRAKLHVGAGAPLQESVAIGSVAPTPRLEIPPRHRP
jgi:hypothetical protein